jgi:DNA repair protein RecO (recombination protein O)
MAVAGWEPALRDCARCGAAGPHRYFSIPAGGAVCVECRPAGAATARPETLALLHALLTSDWTVADASLPQIRRDASGLAVAYLHWHLERALRSMPMVERV